MIVSCPSCAARFSVDESALGPDGRKVKCSKCGHLWTQYPQGEDVPADDALPLNDDALPEAVTRPPADRPRPASRRSAAAPRRSGSVGAMWAVLVIVVAAVLGGAYWFRAEIVEKLPASEILYAAVGLGPEAPYAGLDLVDVAWKQEQSAGGANVLQITGKVVNKSGVPKDVPELAGILYDSGNQVLYQWTFKVPNARLLPTEDVGFKTQVTNPDAKAARLTIQFAETARGAR